METLTRTNVITPNPADPSPPETYTLTAQRTVHGIVHKRGTVDGKPVAFAHQRSTYFHEADSARGFSDLNQPSKVANVQDFQQAVSKIGFTFNWFYADDRDIGYFNSGDNPARADGVSYAVPNWGTGAVGLEGLQRRRTRRRPYTPFAEHPQVVNQHYPHVAGTTSRRRATRPPTATGATAPCTARSCSTSRSTQQLFLGRQDQPARADRRDGGGRAPPTCAGRRPSSGCST